ncbi:hypothetical protein [Ascidiimonas aurantiaca]|uniref:hypothetical protein n=1 Tax=Ascidiimonas aurantiaca TaxID=1685432 RepID=UPI0030EE8CAF
MRKTFITLIICSLTFITKAQNVSVENSIFGIQTGFLGIWIHNELKLSNQFALRTELGLDTGIFGSDVNDINGYLLVPAITAEPRWYYNLNKRQKRSKRVDGNSGNFISIKTTYHPDWFVISNENNINFISDISIIPTWGIRRNIGNHFNYETGFGIGYVHYFEENNVILWDQNEVTVNLHLRIGYRF